jgi:hypothetical protein
MSEAIKLRMRSEKYYFWSYNTSHAHWHLDQGSTISIVHKNVIPRGSWNEVKTEEEYFTTHEQIDDNEGHRFRIVFTLADMPEGQHFYGRNLAYCWLG